ncbi:DUF6671 family protein [Pseudarthrobacter cellobiosi]|uniref:DUF6671 family protein n=1 Tax=Pseudarthrobacter cellobiosi TaxID=2953654 RepID=UPI00208E5058|nr:MULTISPECIES: DUF6671 family protein [unclassified Pseudarthrobacter]MCO4255429.1 hypothetical protein [Pseudarthrobacter sp. HLT1-5]MCO4275481.1 hypothetical protein [Pseudarthrobacter sp. HLT3-5]
MISTESGNSTPPSVYSGERISLLTQHGKERVIVPVLERALGCRLEHVTGYDTDLLGTFTREVPRAGSQLEAARKKAQVGMELSGLPLGIANEGSFGPDPAMGMFPWNIELMIWIDSERELEVVGTAEGKTNFFHLLTADWAEAQTFARESKFPEHHLVVRPDGEHDPRMHKGIAAWPELELAFSRALARSANGKVFLETDMRANANPTRMETIRLAAENLAQKLRSRCPSCDTPGFWKVERVAGLPCTGCGEPTSETRAEIHGCLTCGHRSTRDVTDPPRADPRFCNCCNP